MKIEAVSLVSMLVESHVPDKIIEGLYSTHPSNSRPFKKHLTLEEATEQWHMCILIQFADHVIHCIDGYATYGMNTSM